MRSEIDRMDLEAVAVRAVESLEDLIKVMQNAANQISCGRALEEVDVAGNTLYLARGINVTTRVTPPRRW